VRDRVQAADRGERGAAHRPLQRDAHVHALHNQSVGPRTLRRVLALEQRLSVYPRLRYMGSKHRLGARLGEIFAELPPGPAVDAFSGSGVVSYVLKASGRAVTANDHLAFAAAVTEALVANDEHRLADDDIAALCSGNTDRRD